MAKNKSLQNTLLFIVTCIMFVLYLFPFVLVILNSFKERVEIIRNPLALPENFSFSNYVDAFNIMNFPVVFLNSLIITVISVSLITLFSSMLGYFLVRYDWKINKFIFLLLVASMLIPFQVVMIPFVTIYGNLGMLNNIWALCYFYVGFGASLATFMYHGFIKSIPVELEEAAVVDGATRLQVFFLIVFPMLKSITTTLAIINVLWIWNDFLLPSLVLISESVRTIPLSTFYFFGQFSANFGVAMAGLVLAIIPVIIFYLFSQKQIIQGVVDGAIK